MFLTFLIGQLFQLSCASGILALPKFVYLPRFPDINVIMATKRADPIIDQIIGKD